jgi:hypothetical protein
VHPVHLVVEGSGEHWRGDRVILTELAAEFPQSLCEELAKALFD